MVDTLITLFPSTATSFTSNGLGSLYEATQCIVTEERNGEFELEMKYPVTGARYNDFALRNIILAKSNPYSDPQAFRIYNISKPMNGIITINAEHLSYDLSGYPVSSFTASGITNALVAMKAACPVTCPFNFTTDKTTASTMKIDIPRSLRSCLGGEQGSLLDVYGGEFEFDNFTVKLWNHRGANNGVSIRYGKNLTDLQQEENCANVYTGVYPFWYSEEYGYVELTNKIIYADGTFNFTKILPLDLSSEFSETPTQTQLENRATAYMVNNDIGVPKVSLTVSFLSLEQSDEYKDYALLQTVKLCDTVNIFFPEMGVNATAKCIKTVYDAISNKYESIQLGSARSDLSTTIIDQSEKIEEKPSRTTMEQAVNHATELITGELGGYLVLVKSDDGKPEELLIMDTDDINTATKVWRWNLGGLGYSENGYNGPYSLAMTQEGEIVANFITAGTLSASVIEANSLTSQHISQSYTGSIYNKIGQECGVVTQAFKAADGEILSQIAAISVDFDKQIDTIEANVSSINQTANQLALDFSTQTIGGGNLIKNSSGLNGIAGWTTEGTVTQDTQEASTAYTVSGSSIFMDGTVSQIASIYQDVNVLADHTYTLSVKAKVNGSLNSYIILQNGIRDETLLSVNVSSEWSEYSITFKALGGTVRITAGSYADLWIADCMLVEGNSKCSWSPAPDEIYTANVKVDRSGITVSNPDSDTETIIDNTQFAVKHQGVAVLSVNKDLTYLQRTDIRDELTIGTCRFLPNGTGMDLVVFD